MAHALEDSSWTRLAQAADYVNRPASLADPRAPPIEAMIAAVDEAFPLSSATAILESGCGTGPVLSTILDRPELASKLAQHCSIFASDYSSAMLSHVSSMASQKASQSPNSAWSRVQTQLDDGETMATFSDNSISHILTSYMFFLVADPLSAMRAHHRILCSNGVLATSSLDISRCAWAVATNAGIAAVDPSIPAPMAGNHHTAMSGVEHDFKTAGFRDVRVWEVDAEIGFESRAKWAKFATELLPNVVEKIKHLDEDKMAQVRRAIEHEVGNLTTEEPGVMKGVAIVGIGRK